MVHSLKLRDAFDTAGSVAIEYGLILPAMLLFTLGIMDAGRLLWTNITLTRATEVAARCGAVNVTTCPAASIPAYAATQAQNFGIYRRDGRGFRGDNPRLRRAGPGDLYVPICGSMVPAVFGERAIRRHDDDAQRDSVLSVDALAGRSASGLVGRRSGARAGSG